MTGTAEMTVSPWSCMIMRKTPWVLGCCGPRLRVSMPSPTSSMMPRASIVSKRESPSSGPRGRVRSALGTRVSAMSECPGSASVGLVHELLDGDVVEIGLVVAPHGEADEIVGQQNFAQVRVADEADAHHFE